MGVRVCLPDLGLPAGGAAARLLSSRRRHGLSDRSRRVTGGGCFWLSRGSGRIRCGWRDVPGANLEGRRPAARQCHRSCPRQRTGALGCGTRPGLVAPPVNPQRNHWRHCLAVSSVQRPVGGRWRCPGARLRALLLHEPIAEHAACLVLVMRGGTAVSHSPPSPCRPWPRAGRDRTGGPCAPRSACRCR